MLTINKRRCKFDDYKNTKQLSLTNDTKDYQLINSINSESFQSFLIYGSNEGLVRENIDIILKNFSGGTECEKVNINGKQLDESISLLNDEISTISLFNE